MFSAFFYLEPNLELCFFSAISSSANLKHTLLSTQSASSYLCREGQLFFLRVSPATVRYTAPLRLDLAQQCARSWAARAVCGTLLIKAR